MSGKTYTADEVRTLLRKACEEAGGQRAWARDHGFHVKYISLVTTGRREPGRKMEKALGLERVWRLDNAA